MSAYEKIKPHAKAFYENVPLPPLEDLDYNGSSALINIFSETPFISRCLVDLKSNHSLEHNFKEQFESYLHELEYSPFRTVQELVDYNRENADKELPAGE